MPSPLRLPRGSPPRKALHERSESHTNERSLRMVGEPEAPIYGSSPFPTKPSQILAPKAYSPIPGSTGGASLHVSSGREPQGEISYSTDPATVAALSERNRGSESKSIGPVPTAAEDISTDASSHSHTQANPSNLTSTARLLLMGQEDELRTDDNRKISDDIVQLPSYPSKSEIVRSYALPHTDADHQLVTSKDSDGSLSSSNSTGTVIVKKNRDGRKRASYSAFPYTARPGSSKSNRSITPQKTIASTPGEESSPVSPISPTYPQQAASATPTYDRTPSAPSYANIQASSHSPVNLQYPVIRPPTASASWVESPVSAPQKPIRAMERNQERWNPHLSTVPSEGTGSQSEGRSSQIIWPAESSRASKSSSVAINVRVSSELPSAPIPALPQSPLYPLLSNPPSTHRRDTTGSTIRIVNEKDDNVPSALPAIPGSRDSDLMGFPQGNKRQSVVTRPSSRASFFRDNIPAWARAYYARPSSSAENVSAGIFRPRTRGHANDQLKRDSLIISPIRPAEIDLVEARGLPRHRMSPIWSPHLWHDRRSLGRRRTLFQPPSLDEQAEGRIPDRRSVQILLFAVGFMLPLAWFLAAFLPLPSKPAVSKSKGKDPLSQAQMFEDLEKQLGPIDEARYENARWWRNINRMMSFVGIVIIAAIIALAVVATH